MRACLAVVLLGILLPELTLVSGEQNVCTKAVRKTSFKYHRMIYGRNPVHVIWYPRKVHYNIQTKECCPGWSDYRRGKGCTLRLPCPVRIPSRSSKYCNAAGAKVVQHMKAWYKLNKPKKASDPSTRIDTDLLIPVLDQTATAVRARTAFDPYEAFWFNMYYQGVVQGSQVILGKANAHFGVKQFTTSLEFIQVKQYYAAAIKAMKIPGIYDPTDYYLEITTNGAWKEDRLFAARRLAGLNPFGLKRIASSGAHGMKLSTLRKDLNPSFDWDAAVKAVTGLSLDDAVAKHLVYTVDYSTYRDIAHSPDITDRNPNDTRTLRRSTAPIALFAMGKGAKNVPEFQPVAIQYDYKKDSNVYKPSDGNHWLLAKMQLEIADFVTQQIGVHLAGTHFLMERFCVLGLACFPEHHPLGQLLRRHCVGTVPVNSNGVPALLHEFKIMHFLSAVGHKGAMTVVNRYFMKQHWRDYDMLDELKRRGVDDVGRLPYFPIRDDGILIEGAIRKFVMEYINLYYHSDKDVTGDAILQDYAQQLSKQGTRGANAGVGMVDGFPTSINHREHLAKEVSKILWVVAMHNAANFPLNEFFSSVEPGPTKLYKDSAKLLTPFESLPDSTVATFQATTVMSLTSMRFDSFLDYANKLKDNDARKIVARHYALLHQHIAPIIEKRNKDRIAKNLFGYPYFLPKLMINSISV